MSWRTVVITSRCKLDYKMGFMVVRAEETKKIFLDEIAVLLIENPAVSLTGCLLEALTQKKIRVIFCDAKRNPNAELVPYGDMEHILKFDDGYVIELVVENRKYFFKLVNIFYELIDGGKGDAVLSLSDKPLEFSKYADITVQFAPFQVNRKSLICLKIRKDML